MEIKHKYVIRFVTNIIKPSETEKKLLSIFKFPNDGHDCDLYIKISFNFRTF